MLRFLSSLMKRKRTVIKKQYQRGGRTSKNKTHKLKPMNCHPSSEGKTPNKSSCFTVESLNKIKDAYNKTHQDSQITIKDPHLLWLEMQSRFASCDKEDCWLEQIHDKTLRDRIDEISFAPDHPDKWKRNPDEWLSNYDILEVLEQYEEKHKDFKFIGPTPIDFDSRPHKKSGKCVWQELCDFSLDRLDPRIKKIGVVFNLDKHDEKGSHWVSLYIDMIHKFVFYFDSAGDDIPDEVQRLVDRVQEQWNAKHGSQLEFYKNHPFEHQYENTECGMYSLFFIITLLTQKIKEKHYTLPELIKLFTSKRIPDDFVFNYRKVYFNSN